VRHQGLEPRTH